MTTVILKNFTDTYISEAKPTTNFTKAARLPLRDVDGGDFRIEYYFSINLPVGATVSSAKVHWISEAMGSGTHTVWNRALSAKVGAFSKITWKSRPLAFFPGTESVTKTGALPDGTDWVFDVTEDVSAIRGGRSWLGFELIGSETTARYFYGALATNAARRPYVEIVYSDAPDKPKVLAPGGGRAVSLAKPIVKCDYVDGGGSTSIAGIQVQINSTAVMTSPAFDSGDVAVTAPQLDLSTTVYGGLADNQIVFWRVRVKDITGLWSEWSDVTSFKRDVKGSLNVSNPPSATPPTPGSSAIVEGYTVAPKGLQEFTTLISSSDIKGHIFQAICMDHTTRDIYTSQAMNAEPADNLWISKYTYSTGYTLDSKMSLPSGGHAGNMYFNRNEGGTTYLHFEYGAGQSGPLAGTLPKFNVILPYIANKTWTAAQAQVYTAAAPKYSGLARPANGWYQAETPFGDSFYRLVGAPSQRTPYTAPYIDVIKNKAIVKTINIPEIGRVGLVKTGAPINGRCEVEGISVMYENGAPYLIVGCAVGSPQYASGYSYKLYKYGLPYAAPGIDPNEETFNINTDAYVTEATPPVIWNFTGETQTAYQVFLTQPRLSTDQASSAILWNSGKITSTENSITIPEGKITESGKGYRITLRIWDNKPREATPGDPVYTEIYRDFVFINSTATAPVDTINLVSGSPLPYVDVQWNRGTAADSYSVVRNGQVIASGLLPVDTLVSDIDNVWRDNAPDTGIDLNYQVVAVVNGKSAGSSPVATTQVRVVGTWLRAADGTSVQIFDNKSNELKYTEQSSQLQVVGSTEPILVTQGLMGLSGSVKGTLRNTYGLGAISDNDATDWYNNFLTLKSYVGQTMYLTIGGLSLTVVVSNMTIQAGTSPERYYNVSFDWFQTGSVRFSSPV